MPRLNLASNFAFISSLSTAPLRPLQVWIRNADEHFRPPIVRPHAPKSQRTGEAIDHGAKVLRQAGSGRLPTIVLGGLVPDSSEQVFLLRRWLLKFGDLYYLNYPRTGFSLEAIQSQLTELVDELAAVGQTPVVFGVSFGAGILIDWLRRARERGASPQLGGVVLVSPVTCVADLIAPGSVKPATLLGRALKPFLDPTRNVSEEAVEKSRTLFLRMFEAGAQNKAALRSVMTANEAHRLRVSVMDTIRGVSWKGGCERVQALAAMPAPTDYFSPALLPLTKAPVLVLFAEREEGVLDAQAPVVFAFERAHRAYFSDSTLRRVKARPGEPPVQHASLVFHVFEFLAPLQAFYQQLRRGPVSLAA